MRKEFIKEVLNDVWNNRNFKNLNVLMDEHVKVNGFLGKMVGLTAFKQYVSIWLLAFPDYHIEEQGCIEDGNKIVMQWKATGTHTGPFLHYAPSGNKIDYQGVTIYTFVEDKIMDYDVYIDPKSFLSQII